MLPALIALVDGGVYDNLAEQWLTGSTRRRRPDGVQQPDVFIVVNSSASIPVLPVGSFHFPIVGEIAALKRDTSIMYDNSASIRKRDLIDLFDTYAVLEREMPSPPVGMPGALIDIRSDPFAAATFFSGKNDMWPERARRAQAILDRKPVNWESDAAWAAGIKTTLSKLGIKESARLLHHSYTLTAMNLHLFLDMPLVDVLPKHEFVSMAEAGPA